MKEMCKGDLMYVEGKLRTRQYTDQQGVVRYVTEVNADKMMQLAPARPVQQSSYGQPYTGEQPAGYSPIPSVSEHPDPFQGTEPENDLPF